MKPITFHPLVQADVSQAMQRYAEISERLEEELWQEFQVALTEIHKIPKRHKDQFTGYCRYNLRQFPYNMLYIEYQNKIRIQVFRHNKRRESFGSYRKKN